MLFLSIPLTNTVLLQKYSFLKNNPAEAGLLILKSASIDL